ncbi:MAG: hypothetical protein CR217_09695 [Beijerinckiaceae bacterium]|nr:MAG: hypothetical protein CR217_09695 [Beijerinckiaceae bacterium]
MNFATIVSANPGSTAADQAPNNNQLRRARVLRREPAPRGNRLTAGLGGSTRRPGRRVSGGRNREVAGHCAGRGAFERDGQRSWLN